MNTTTTSRLALCLCCAAIVSCANLATQERQSQQGNLDRPPGGSRYLVDSNTPPASPQDNTEAPKTPDDTTQPLPPPTTSPENKTPDVTTNPTPSTPPPPPAGNQTPYGKPVPGKKGFVYSPYDEKAGMIDVRDYSPGTKVRDPYTNKIFLVP